MNHRFSSFVLAAAICLSPVAAFAEDDPAQAVVGRWYTEGGDSKVEIEEKDGEFVGKIAWLKNPLYEEGDPEEGKPLRDRNNPDADLQNKPILGLKMLHSFKYDEKKEKWVDGKIYDPEKGKTYDCQMTLEGDKLNVRGYIGSPVFGRTTTWTKVTEEDEKRDKDVGAEMEE